MCRHHSQVLSKSHKDWARGGVHKLHVPSMKILICQAQTLIETGWRVDERVSCHFCKSKCLIEFTPDMGTKKNTFIDTEWNYGCSHVSLPTTRTASPLRYHWDEKEWKELCINVKIQHFCSFFFTSLMKSTMLQMVSMTDQYRFKKSVLLTKQVFSLTFEIVTTWHFRNAL